MLNRFKDVPISTIICGFIVVLMMLFVLFTSGSNQEQTKIVVDNKKIIELFNKIDNNYKIKVERTVNDKKEEFTYYYDGKLELYETNSIEVGYLVYDGKVYELNSSEMKLSRIDTEPYFINDSYSNIKLIKNVINKCEFEYIDSTKVNCKLQEADFINEMNNYYDNKYDNYSLDYLNIEISYHNNINKLSIDYTNINKLINNNDSCNYDIYIQELGKNDFSKLYEYFKLDLK